MTILKLALDVSRDEGRRASAEGRFERGVRAESRAARRAGTSSWITSTGRGLEGETATNLRVRCRAHNALYAEQVFGRAHVASRRHLRQRKNAPPAPVSFETAAQGLRSLGFRELEARRAVQALATKHDMQAAPVETILREALLVLT